MEVTEYCIPIDQKKKTHIFTTRRDYDPSRVIIICQHIRKILSFPISDDTTGRGWQRRGI